MRRFIAGLLVFAAASVVGCGSDDDEAETCCNYLESNRDVANGCSVYSAEDAKRLCT